MWEAVVTEIEDRLQSRDECWMKWKSVRNIADHQRWSVEQRQTLHAELSEAGILTYPGLDVVHPNGGDRITFFPEDRKEKYFGLRFAKEKHFRSTMLQGLHRIPELQDLRQIKKEFRLSNNRRIDVLAKRGRDTWVIVELKRGDGRQQVASQVRGYVRDLRKQLVEGEKPLVKDDDKIEAVVLSQAFDRSAAEELSLFAERDGFTARWLVAKIKFHQHRLTESDES